MRYRQIDTDFASVLKQRRLDLGLTQEQMAERLGLSSTGYRQIENASVRPQDLTRHKIEKALSRFDLDPQQPPSEDQKATAQP